MCLEGKVLPLIVGSLDNPFLMKQVDIDINGNMVYAAETNSLSIKYSSITPIVVGFLNKNYQYVWTR